MKKFIMRFGFIFTFLLFLAFPVLAQTGEDVSSLVKNLTSPSAAKRAAAEKELLSLGPAILPFLPESGRTPEAKMRLSRIRLELERQAAENSLEAGMVTLPNDTKSLNAVEIISLVSRQTRNPLKTDLPESTIFPEVEVGKPMEFWAFLDSFCDRFHLEPQTLNGKKGLKLVLTDTQIPRSARQNSQVAYLKPFRLEAIRTRVTAQNSALLRLELAWEPRVQPVFAYLRLNEGVFDGEVPVKFPEIEYEILIGQKEFRAFCDIPLSARLMSPGAKTLTVRGTLSAVACGMKKDFTFDTLDQKLDRAFQPVSARTAALLLTFSRLRTEKTKKNTYLVATLRYRYEEAHEAMESHRTWIYENDATLRMPDGTEIASEYSELLRQTPNEISVDVFFPMNDDTLKNLSGWQLVFPRPCGIYEVKVPFELKEIPLKISD